MNIISYKLNIKNLFNIHLEEMKELWKVVFQLHISKSRERIKYWKILTDYDSVNSNYL